MKDIESLVINTLMNAVGSGVSIGSVYTNTPSSFPYVSVIEADNYMSHLDDGDNEKFSTVSYDVNVYSNNADTPKSEARQIMKIVDNEMYRMNFKRLSMKPLPNVDTSVYRLYATYEAETDGTYFYRR